MLTRADISRMLTSGVRREFMKAYKDIPSVYKQVTTEIKSTKASEDYGWLGATGGLREWKSERAPEGLLEHGFTLTNKDYEASIAVDRNAIEDDQYGQVMIRVKQMGAEAAKSYDEFFADTVEDGHTEACYDGQNFFDTDHEEGDSGTQSNYSSSGMALSVANCKTIITTMKQYKNDKGRKILVNPTHIMVPAALEWVADEIFNPATYTQTTTDGEKQMKGRLKVIVNQYLSDTGGANAAYYILDLSNVVKPFIYQNRKSMTFVALDKPDSESLFFRKSIFYGVDARFVFGYGDWRFAYKAKG